MPYRSRMSPTQPPKLHQINPKVQAMVFLPRRARNGNYSARSVPASYHSDGGDGGYSSQRHSSVSVASAQTLEILISINGKPLCTHKIFNIPISPNTLISIFSTLSSASMMFAVGDCLGQLKWTFFQQRVHRLKDLQIFDNASRGPIGSVVLLRKLNIRAFIASIGALITIAALANDPFTQALLSYNTISVHETNATASIPRSRVFLGKNAPGARAFPFLSNGFYRGLFTPDLQVGYTCTSGHCIWPRFESLAFCSACTDISDNLNPQCSTSNHGSGMVCNFTAPLGHVLYNNYSVRGDNIGSYNVIVSQGIPADNSVNNICEQGQMVWADVLSFEESYDYTGNASESAAVKPLAYECSLSWCMKTFEPTFRGGKLHDRVINSTMLTFTKDSANAIYINSVSQTWLGVVGSEFPADFDACGAYQSNQTGVFWVGGSLLGFWGTLVNALTDTTTTDAVEPTSNPVGAALSAFNGGNVSQSFEQIATGLTDAVRQAPGTEPVIGKALGPEVFVHVNWNWLAFPATVVFLTTVFVIFSVVFSFEKGRSIWKTSSLALLFHGLDGWTDQELDVQGMEEMEKKARKMNAILTRGGGGRMVFVQS